MHESILITCLHKLLGEKECRRQIDSLEIDERILKNESISKQTLNRAQIAMLMNILLFKNLLERVPEGQTYTKEKVEKHQKITFDHGALRTVAIKMKHLPFGKDAFSRILIPLGYELAGEYPLDKLKMCGFVYTHRDYPEDIPQYFVSELYPERFGSDFRKIVKEIVYESQDPLSEQDIHKLKQLNQQRSLNIDSAINLLKVLPGCFDRQHDIPSLDQYKYLLTESAEMAWIATEGNAFNHATDRVSDLDLLEKEERNKGRNLKPQIEEGQNANIRQTAYRATVVERSFKDNNADIKIQVPGSFFEFIERGTVFDQESGDEKMDLRFDSRNAQGIFKMTEKS